MKNPLNSTPFRLRSDRVFPAVLVRFSLLAIVSFLSARTFANTLNPRFIAQTKAAPPASFGGLAVGIEVWDINKLDRIPEVEYRTDVQYPFEMRRGDVTGEVTVEFIVDANGNVMNAFAVRSSRKEFEANALSAVSKWRFKPGQKKGRNVYTRMQMPIVFTLNGR